MNNTQKTYGLLPNEQLFWGVRIKQLSAPPSPREFARRLRLVWTGKKNCIIFTNTLEIYVGNFSIEYTPIYDIYKIKGLIDYQNIFYTFQISLDEKI